MVSEDAIGYMVLPENPKGYYMREFPAYVNTRRVMLRYARSIGLRLRQVPYDWGDELRGGFTNRHGLAKAIGLTRNSRVDFLVISSLESLGLSELETAVLMLAFRKFGVEVYETKSMDALTMQVDRWQEIVLASDPKVRSVAERGLVNLTKQATRLWNNSRSGKRPFGENPEEKRILERIWELRRKKRDGSGRTSYSKIADELNSSGERPRQGKKWHARTIQGIVKRTRPHLDKN